MAHGNAFRNHLAKREVHRVWAQRRYWHFTFSDQWGPLLTDEWGEPVSNMPLADEEHPFWDVFEVWQKARSQAGTTERPALPREAVSSNPNPSPEIGGEA